MANIKYHGDNVTAVITHVSATVPTCEYWNIAMTRICRRCPDYKDPVYCTGIEYNKKITVGCAGCGFTTSFRLDKNLIILFSNALLQNGEQPRHIHQFVCNRVQEVHADYLKGKFK